MSKEAAQTTSADTVVWFDGKAINEVIFCEEFLRDYGKSMVVETAKILTTERNQFAKQCFSGQ